MQLQKVKVTLPIELVRKMDVFMEKKKKSRDEIIREALYFYIMERINYH